MLRPIKGGRSILNVFSLRSRLDRSFASRPTEEGSIPRKHLYKHPFWGPFFGLFSLSAFVILPYQVLLVVVTLLWLAVTQALGRGLARVGLWRSLSVRVKRGLARVGERVLKNPAHGAYLPTILGLGIFMPALFIASIVYQVKVAGVGSGGSVDWFAVFGYHVIWLGPNHLFFAHVTTLLHQQGHQKRITRKGWGFLDYWLSYALGVIYGHVPENFPVGHNRIHHKYNNGPRDVTTTLDLNRGTFLGWLGYRTRFFLYWTGTSVAHFFWTPKTRQLAHQQLRGMFFIYGLMMVGCVFSPTLTLAYLIIPHLIVLNFLSAINFVWHGFIDPADPGNLYSNSVTIVDAEQDVWDEAYHVAHHARAGAPWTEQARHYDATGERYEEARSLVFEKTQVFEIFGLMMAGRIDLIAQKAVVRGREDLTQEELEEQIRARMQPIVVAEEGLLSAPKAPETRRQNAA